ncbi:Predicted thioesterase [Fervidobacterium changbaicum]|uniref:Thioesterase n=2 Tax=Fervidobacterium TaxID=2422 RepID=A0AAI8CKY6_FERIS|nr:MULTISPECIES: hotdog domain-containing protein [Fervidobacterium]AMW32245.1 thioesterase [Fervidobacterium islandicum]QAV32415.1 thioesterase [Fervidobacterium changbaicum]SDH18733.1 Predicted thioesterase [Fervidobacterium changbaicum]
MERFENLLGLNKSFEIPTDESMIWDEDDELSYLHLVSTSSLFREISAVSFDFLRNYLNEDETSVVTKIEIEHVAPVVVGERLVAGLRIVDVHENHITFKALVLRESQKVAEITITRVVVSKSYLRRKALEHI